MSTSKALRVGLFVIAAGVQVGLYVLLVSS